MSANAAARRRRARRRRGQHAARLRNLIVNDTIARLMDFGAYDGSSRVIDAADVGIVGSFSNVIVFRDRGDVGDGEKEILDTIELPDADEPFAVSWDGKSMKILKL